MAKKAVKKAVAEATASNEGSEGDEGKESMSKFSATLHEVLFQVLAECI